MKSEIMKADSMSETTKAESHIFQSSADSRRGYIRPRTNSPFPPLKVKVGSKYLNYVRQSESFNSSMNNNIIDIRNETKLSPEPAMLADYRALNYEDVTWTQFLKDKKKGGHRGRDTNTHFRISSAQQSNPFLDSSTKRFCFSIDKHRSMYRIGEMSAPGSANSFEGQMSNPRRNRTNLNENVKMPYIGAPEESVPVKIDEDKKTFINWKAVAVNSSDLGNKDREMLGFSPPYIEQIKEHHKRDSSLVFFKSKFILSS
jgi:hypothetical protein